ncbi:MAG TPA: AI-2E family transporter [Nitrospira sp.]|nr:AI-2E family transporter [Nitrospira sp.]
MSSRIISGKGSWRDASYAGGIIAAGVLLLYLLGTVLLPFVAACLAAYLLTPIVEFLERRGLTRRGAVTLLYGVSLILISGVIAYVMPSLDREMRSLHIELPRYSSQIHHGLIQLQDEIQRDVPVLTQFNLAERIEQASFDMRERLSTHAFLLVSSLLFVPLFTWYLLLEGGAMKKSLISLVPNAYFETALNLLYRIDRHLSRYLFGQLINVVCISVLSAIGYSLIGVQFGIAIGILAGVASIIPYVGSLIGASTAVLLSLLDEFSFSKVLAIVLVSAAIYAFDHLVVKTIVVSKSTDLHPLTVVSVLLIGGHLFGLWGLLFGIPLFCTGKIFVQEFAGVLQRRSPPVPSSTRVQSTSPGLLPPL